MFFFYFLILQLSSALAGPPEGPRLGVQLGPGEAEAMALNVFPDGNGLPEGQGDLTEGARLYEGRCAHCHGPKGTGGSAPELVGRSPLDGPHPDLSIGNYWPYATTLFDFIRRSMPLDAPRTLSDNQVYALTGYLLELNGLIETKDSAFDRETLLRIKMPNREGFISLWPDAPNKIH